MSYKIVDVTGSGREIVSQIMLSSESQLMIPPKLSDKNPVIEKQNFGEKHIGLFSSGTTDSPKCIWNTYRNLVRNARYTAEAFGVNSNHRLLMMAAPWHVAGLSWAIMAEELGCEYKFITTRKGEGEHWLKSVKEFKPDFLMTVPVVLRALYGKDWFVPNVVFGGYSMEKEELHKLKPHCNYTIQGYGQTEAGGLIAAHKRKSSDALDAYDHLCSGNPIEGVELRCNGSPENPAPIFIRSNTAFTNNEYDSRDLGFIDEIDRVYVLGRADKIVQKK